MSAYNGGAPPLPAIIREGERDAQLTSFAGTMRRWGASQEAILAALEEINDERCRPPLDDAQVEKIAHSVARYPASASLQDAAHDAALYALNERYAVIQVGKDVRFLQQSPDDRSFELLSEDGFRLLHADQFVETTHTTARGKTIVTSVPLAKAWLAWKGHRRYTGGLVFKPGQKVVPEAEFNMWRGWAVEPVGPGRCGLFRRHLLAVVCGGNAAHCEWLLDWLADIVQHPMRKLGHVVALRGAQGVGKSLVGHVMQQLLGKHHTVAEKPEHVTGRFNGHLAYCLLLQAEEAFWSGDKRARSVLKHLVTGRDQQIERKGIDQVQMPNYTRLLITSNERWVWPASVDDRRLVIFDVKATHRGDVRYFDALFAEIEDGGAAAFLRFLLARKIDERRLKVPPTTRALEEQAVLTMAPEEAWVLSVLKSGRLPVGVVDDEGRAHVPIRSLHEAYTRDVPRGQYALNAEQFSLFLRPYLPRAKDAEYRGPHRYYSPLDETREDRRRYVQSKTRVIAPLARCRQRYSESGRAAPKTWPKARAWRTETDR